MLTLFILSCQSHPKTNGILLSPEIFRDSIQKMDAQIIDVRTSEEFNTKHIQKAHNLNYFSKKFADSVGLLDTNKSVFIYCRSGKRSSKSVSFFKDAGFKNVYELEGGFLNWISKDF